MRLAAALAFLLASCAAPMRLTLVCNGKTRLLADVTPGVTHLEYVTWQMSPDDGAVRCEAHMEERK